MDFADFDLATVAEKGTWLHFELNDTPLYRQDDDTIGTDKTDKPCRVLLKGMGSDATMSIMKEISRAEAAHNFRMQRSKDSEIEGLIVKYEAASDDTMKRMIDTSVAEWENIMLSGKEAPCDTSNKLKICGPGTAFFNQTYQKILERHDFLKGAAKKS